MMLGYWYSCDNGGEYILNITCLPTCTEVICEKIITVITDSITEFASLIPGLLNILTK